MHLRDNQPPYTHLPNIERNIGSLYATLDVLLNTGQQNTALRLAGVIYPYWEAYEYLSDGVNWLSRISEQPEVKDAAELHHMIGNLRRHQSDYAASQQHYQHGLAALGASDDVELHTSILSGIGETAFRQGLYTEANSYYQTHLSVGQQANDGRRVADSMNALGRLATVNGQMAEALEYHDYGHALCDQHHYEVGRAWWLNALGELERARGCNAKAAEYFQGSASLFEQLGNTGTYMLALQNLAFVTLPVNPARAQQMFKQVLAFWLRGPAQHGLAVCLVGLSKVELAAGKHRRAAQLLAIATHVLARAGVRLELGDRMDYESALISIQGRISQKHYDALHDELSMQPTQTLIAMAALPSKAQPSTPLTSRETRLLALAAQGFTDKQMALELGISPYTVNTHLKSIYSKLGVGNRTAAVAAGRRLGVIP